LFFSDLILGWNAGVVMV